MWSVRSTEAAQLRTGSRKRFLPCLVLLLSATAAARSRTSSSEDRTALVGDAIGLQCPPCERVHCSPRRPSRLRCRGGIVRGVCNCCPVCAKLEGDPCGGQWNYLGRCDAGLYCDTGGLRQPVRDARSKMRSSEDYKGRNLNSLLKTEGYCRKGQELSDSPAAGVTCLPRCTPEYCRQNVKALCSAVDNGERKQPCQGDCQHTSCSACRYVRPQFVDCAASIRCSSPEDSQCLRRFGRCMRRQQCSRQWYPCNTNNRHEDGLKFHCIVPECSSSPYVIIK